MNTKKKHTLLTLACFMTIPIMCYSQVNQSIDLILKNAKLNHLIDTNQVVNLIAQPLTPGSTKNVNGFNDFIAIGTIHTPNDTYITHMVQFNRHYKVINEVTFNKPWGGVAPFTQVLIPSVSLQDGLIEVQRCMQQKGTPVPGSKVTNVIIYKTLYPGQMVYDYSFSIPGDEECQEVLYIPDIGDCMLGAKKACHMTIKHLKKKLEQEE